MKIEEQTPLICQVALTTDIEWSTKLAMCFSTPRMLLHLFGEIDIFVKFGWQYMVYHLLPCEDLSTRSFTSNFWTLGECNNQTLIVSVKVNTLLLNPATKIELNITPPTKHPLTFILFSCYFKMKIKVTRQSHWGKKN